MGFSHLIQLQKVHTLGHGLVRLRHERLRQYLVTLLGPLHVSESTHIFITKMRLTAASIFHSCQWSLSRLRLSVYYHEICIGEFNLIDV